MHLDYRADVQIALEDDAPIEMQQAILEHQQADQQAKVQRAGEVSRQVSALEDAHRHELQELLGAERYQAFRAYVDDAHGELAKQLEPPHGLEVTQEALDRLQTERREAGEAYLRANRIDIAELRAANARLRERFGPVIAASRIPDDRTEPIVLLEDVPPDVLSGKGNPWTIRRPPYAGGSASYPSSVDEFSFSPTNYMDPVAGLAGNSNYLKNGSAGDFDFAWVDFDTALGFSYRMPATGLVEIWVEAQCSDNHHHLTLSNEWGWSDAWDYQYAYLATQVLGTSGGDWRYNTVSTFHEEGTDGYWNRHNLTNGKTYWAHTLSDLSYAKGQWVFIWAGAMNSQRAFCNDVSLYGDIRFKWFIKSVRVDSTG